MRHPMIGDCPGGHPGEHRKRFPDSDDHVPVLLAVSDNGPQMRSTKTAEFMAIARIAQHSGRPGTPNDQAWVDSSATSKANAPTWTKSTTPAVLRHELQLHQVWT